jgi:hypothetical protein
MESDVCRAVDEWVACVDEHAAHDPWSSYRAFDLDRPHHCDPNPDGTQLALNLPCEGTERESRDTSRPTALRLLSLAATSMIGRH